MVVANRTVIERTSPNVLVLPERTAMPTSSVSSPTSGSLEFIDPIIHHFSGKPGALLGILEAVQEKLPHNYLPANVLRYVAEKTNKPYSRIYSVATFYALFNLEPQGDHTICVCRGTACHTRGSRVLLERLEMDLGLGGKEQADSDNNKVAATTPDGKFTVRTVACFGQCALAPVVEVDHRICGHVNERTLHREVSALGGSRSK
jgi:NADH-quinone oxidoreductase subunit E